MGVIAGIMLPPKVKKPAIAAAATMFIATYIPLMVKYGKIVAGLLKKTERAAE